MNVKLSFLMANNQLKSGAKIAVGHQIFPTELIKSLVSYVDKFSKMYDSKKIYIDKSLK